MISLFLNKERVSIPDFINLIQMVVEITILNEIDRSTLILMKLLMIVSMKESYMCWGKNASVSVNAECHESR